MKMTFSKLGLKAKKEITSLKLSDDINLEIRNYLPSAFLVRYSTIPTSTLKSRTSNSL